MRYLFILIIYKDMKEECGTKCRVCATGALNKERKFNQAKIKNWDKIGTNRLKMFVLRWIIHPYKQRVIGSSPITPTKRKNCNFARFQNIYGLPKNIYVFWEKE